jgi:hypothetical protein
MARESGAAGSFSASAKALNEQAAAGTDTPENLFVPLVRFACMKYSFCVTAAGYSQSKTYRKTGRISHE